MGKPEPVRSKKTPWTLGEFTDIGKIPLLVVIAVLCMVPGFCFSRLHVTDGFLFQVIAYVRLTLPVDRLEIFTKGGYSFGFIEFLPGYPLILSLFSRLAAVSPEQLHFMPIAAILVPLCYFALAHKLFRSITISSLFALYGAYDIGLASHYNVFAYTWSNLIYLGFVLMSLRLTERKRSSDAIILFVLFAGSLFMHYAGTMWLIAFMFIFNLSLYIRKRWQRLTESSQVAKNSFAMPFAFAIAFLSFNQIFYRVWLPSFQRIVGESGDPIELFAAKIGSYLGQVPVTTEKYRLFNLWGESFGWWRIAEYLLILTPICLWFLKMGVDLLRGRPIQIKHSHYTELTIVMVVTALIDWFVYGIYSGINMRYASLMFPLLSVIALDQLNVSAWVRKMITASLILTAVITYAIGLRYYLRFPPTSYAQTQVGSDWLLDHQVQGPVLSDLDTLGLFLVAGSDDDGDFPSSIVYDSELYASVVDPGECTNGGTDYRFVIVDSEGIEKPLHGIHNHIYEPLSRHLTGIRANSCLTRVYDDGSISILIKSGEEVR